MEPSRPLANRRLLQAIEVALASSDPVEVLSLAELQRKMAVLSQEKRFLTFAAMMREAGYLTSQEIATKIRDQHSNVLRNLHALVAERLMLVQRDEDTGICRYAVNRDLTGQISVFFSTPPKPVRAKPTR
jgi:RNase P/RNase MRP subunit POP5